MKKLLILLLFPILSFSQVISVKKYKDVYNTGEQGIVRIYLDTIPTSPVTVNYTITGNAADNVNISSGSHTFNGTFSHDLIFEKTSDVSASGESLTVSISTPSGYTDIRTSDDLYVYNESIKAFPTAEGAGTYAIGGRGGTVLHVTRLDDPAWTEGNWTVGTFRWAMEQTYPRIIVFDVSGTIVLDDFLFAPGNVTVAGHTAPEGGITIQGPTVAFFNTTNVIIRYVRFVNTNRFVFPSTYPSGAAFVASGSNNVILDHCSFRYTTGTSGVSFQDNNDTSDGQGNITIQNSIIGDCFTGMLAGAIATDDNRSALAGSNSVIKNLFINIAHRFPNVSGNGRYEIYNNVVYNYADRMSSLFNNSETNILNNYYKSGYTSGFSFGMNHMLGVYLTTSSFNFPKLHIANNVWDMTVSNRYSSDFSNRELNAGDNNWLNVYKWHRWDIPESNPFAKDPGNELYALDNTVYSETRTFWNNANGYSLPESQDLTPYKLNTALPFLGANNMLTAAAAYNIVTTDVGANKYLNANGSFGSYLDLVDAAYINDVVNGGKLTVEANGDYLDGTNQNSLTYPTLPTNTRPANYDTDNDGMPDVWETATFGNLNRDGTGDLDGDGYTDLEEFLNLVDTATVSAAPQITLNGNATLVYTVGDTYTELGATVTDDEDTGLTATITGVQNGATLSVAGTYQVYYNATDSDGNAATQVTRTIIVNASTSVETTTSKSSRIRLIMN